MGSCQVLLDLDQTFGTDGDAFATLSPEVVCQCEFKEGREDKCSACAHPDVNGLKTKLIGMTICRDFEMSGKKYICLKM